jgi:beta-phosphoglucomutase-like phosphatase (HAD superfamily)
MDGHLVLDAMGVIFLDADDFEGVYLPYFRDACGLGGEALEKARRLYYGELTLGKISSAQFFGSLGIPESYGFLERLQMDPEFPTFAHQFSGQFAISVLSNDSAEWAGRIAAKFELDGLVDYYTSGEFGYRKPDGRAYMRLLERLGNPSRCIYVDNLAENLQPAEKAGFEPVYFSRDGGKAGPFPSVKSFAGLGEFLMGGGP